MNIKRMNRKFKYIAGIGSKFENLYSQLLLENCRRCVYVHSSTQTQRRIYATEEIFCSYNIWMRELTN